VAAAAAAAAAVGQTLTDDDRRTAVAFAAVAPAQLGQYISPASVFISRLCFFHHHSNDY